METLLLSAEHEEDFNTAIFKSAETIEKGGLVAFPTETFYGLGANIKDPNALKKIFEVKGRADNVPVLLLVGDMHMVEYYASYVSKPARRIMELFWPGGVTLIFNASDAVNPVLSAGTGKIGIRYSSHPVPSAISIKLGYAITGTSANISGKASPDSAEKTLEQLGNKIELIIDSGLTRGIKPSTVIDVSNDNPAVVREGCISSEAIFKVAL